MQGCRQPRSSKGHGAIKILPAEMANPIPIAFTLSLSRPFIMDCFLKGQAIGDTRTNILHLITGLFQVIVLSDPELSDKFH